MKGYVSIVSSSFKKGSFKGESGCIKCCGTSTSYTIDSCEFIDNKFSINSAAVSVTTSTCITLLIKSSSTKRIKFSGKNITNPISGHFIKTISSKVSISYLDFIDTIYSGNGNAIMIDEQQAFQINFVLCTFSNLRKISEDKFTTKCQAQQNNNIESIILIKSQQSDIFTSSYARFSKCIFINNKGNVQSGSIAFDIKSKCAIDFIDCYFNDNEGINANDILIRSNNSQTELNSSNFETSFSDSIQPHIITINNQQQQIINLNHFTGTLFVSNKTDIGIKNGIRVNPYQQILDSISKLDYSNNLIHIPRTIYILDNIWNEYISFSFTNSLIIKSGLGDDQIGIRHKTDWITTTSSNQLIQLNIGDLTLESFQFNFTNINGYITPIEGLMLVDSSGSTNSSLTIISCIFNGLGMESTSFRYMIHTDYLKQIVVKECIFQDGSIFWYGLRFNSNIQNSEFLIQNCQFLKIKGNTGDMFGAVLVYCNAANFKASIINCTFDNCVTRHDPSTIDMFEEAAYTSTSKYIINNNKFINCKGNRTGGIWIYRPTNIQLFDNEFFNNSNNNAYYSKDSYVAWSALPSGWNAANTYSNIQTLFDGSTSDIDNGVYYIQASNNKGYISLAKPEYVYFINQEILSGSQSGIDKYNPLRQIQSIVQQQQYRNSKLIFNLIGSYHNESIIIKSNAVWKSIEIRGQNEQEIIMRRNNEDLNGAIITLTTNSITPTTIMNMKMIVDFGFFIIQQSKKVKLKLSNIQFIGQGTVQQEGLALLSIEQCSFKLSNNISVINPIIQAIRGQLEINSCSFGTALETKLGSPAIQISALCTNIKFAQTIFSNLHSNISNYDYKASTIVIEMGEKTNIEFIDCIFLQCVDSSQDKQHSSGAVCIISKNSKQDVNQILNYELITSSVSFTQCHFSGCQGYQSGAIIASFDSNSENERLKIIVNKCNFIGCGSKNSFVGVLLLIGDVNNNNYGEAYVINNNFTDCKGIKVGGILFGENIKPMNSQNNFFSDNKFISSIEQGASDIFFQSKELLDQVGGISCVNFGYKSELDKYQQITSDVKIDGFSTNFASYLDCITRNEDNEEQCGEIPCGGELNIQSEQCEYEEQIDQCLNVIGKSKYQCPCKSNDPRDICKQICIPTSETEVTEECPCYAIGDPRQQCKTIIIPSADTPISESSPCLANNDPRSECKTIIIPSESTPISETSPCLANNDPRSECKQQCIPTIDTSINECPCLEMNDPRMQCQKSCIPTPNTLIDECCCFDIDDPRQECKKQTQSGLDDEKQQDQSEIENPKQQQEEAKKEGLSSGFIASIVISSVLAIIIVILIIVIIHLIRKKKIFRTGEELIVVRPNANNQTNNNQQEDIIQEENRFIVHSNENDLRNNYKSEYDQDTHQQQPNQQQNIKQNSLQHNISELNGKQKQQINPNFPPSSSHQQDRPQTNKSIPSTPYSLNSYSPNQQ